MRFVASPVVVDPRFLAVLRRHLPYLTPADEVPVDAPLRELGLDSMAAVGLVLDLEKEFELTFGEQSLQPETFASASRLWTEVARSGRS